MPNVNVPIKAGGGDPAIDLSQQQYLEALAIAYERDMPPEHIVSKLFDAAEKYDLAFPKEGYSPWGAFPRSHPLPDENKPFSVEDQDVYDRLMLVNLLNEMPSSPLRGRAPFPTQHQIEPIQGVNRPIQYAVGPNVADSPPRPYYAFSGQEWPEQREQTLPYQMFQNFGSALEGADAPFRREEMEGALSDALFKAWIDMSANVEK